MTRDLFGQTVVVTGGNAGLGYFTAEQLARRGARIVIASRTESKANAAIASLRRQVDNLQPPVFVHLDLADLASVARAAHELSELPSIDVLVANGGITRGTADSVTADGFESMFGTNHLGHFALISGLLSPLPGRRESCTWAASVIASTRSLWRRGSPNGSAASGATRGRSWRS
jgi:NAD(P)-dependent dehydrogenase (short-subunit alcohol dehydrogenase family)